MLTVDLDRLGARRDELLLDAGCGAGRHSHAALARGLRTVALDRSPAEALATREGARRLSEMGVEVAPGLLVAIGAELGALPFADATFDRVIASEVLEHVADDRAAIGELVRVLRPGGTLAITVPRCFPERVCWLLSADYHRVDGGHLRIYRGDRLAAAVCRAGVVALGRGHAHALHTPYWWLRCLVGVHDDRQPLSRLYHRVLVWQLMRRPRWLNLLERALDPVLGKSLVLYFRRPRGGAAAGRATGELSPAA